MKYRLAFYTGFKRMEEIIGIDLHFSAMNSRKTFLMLPNFLSRFIHDPLFIDPEVII